MTFYFIRTDNFDKDFVNYDWTFFRLKYDLKMKKKIISWEQ